MEIGEKLYANSREAWRLWLEAHHQEQGEIWLVLYKLSSGKRVLTLDQAQEEALCFGWIDSQMKPLDEESFAQRFTPRRSRSNWSQVNRDRALRLLREGRMTPAGMALLPAEVLQAWEE